MILPVITLLRMLLTRLHVKTKGFNRNEIGTEEIKVAFSLPLRFRSTLIFLPEINMKYMEFLNPCKMN